MRKKFLLLAAFLLLPEQDHPVEKRKNRRKKKFWVRKWLQERETRSAYIQILRELALCDEDHFRRYLRMDCDTFKVSMLVFFVITRFVSQNIFQYFRRVIS